MIKFNEHTFELKPYSIETGMAYNNYIEPLRSAYLLDFAGVYDEDYVNQYHLRIAEQHDIVNSFDSELTDEQKELLKVHTDKLEALKLEFLNDAKAQAIEAQIDKLKENALMQTFSHTAQCKKFFDAVLIGDTSKIVYEGAEYYNFGAKVLTDFFLQMTKTLNESVNSLKDTAN